MGVDRFLRAGVTEPRVDPEAEARWAAAAHQALRESGGRVLGHPLTPTTGRNHYLLRIELANGTPARLMLNAAAQLVAAATDDPHALATPFVNVPRPDLFELMGLHTATPATLETPLTTEHCASLTTSERHDIAYHHPARLGDVLFNWFD